MKKNLFLLVLLLGGNFLFGQQKPQYTEYILNNYIINPALSGIENYTDVKISNRNQWVGLNGAPQTMYLTVHTPIGKKDYKTSATSFQVPGENPRGKGYWENYTASESHHGVGLSIVNDKTGLYNRSYANLSYAYHIGLSPRTNMAAGFAGGITKLSRDASRSTYANNDPTDPAQGSVDDVYKVRPDLSAGIWVYSADYFFGVSAQQIIPQKVSFVDDTLGFKLVPHLFLTTGYRFLITDDINAVPSLMIKYVSPLDPQLDANIKLQYRDLFWIGASCRFRDGFGGMLGLNISNTFNVGYAYDYTTSNLGTVSKGTHEIIIGFLLGNRYDDSCPRNIW